VLQLIQSIESLLVHGLLTVPMRRTASNSSSSLAVSGGGSWEFIKCVADQLPESRMVVDLVEQMPNVAATLSPKFWRRRLKKSESNM
jgi:hypothetical protein